MDRKKKVKTADGTELDATVLHYQSQENWNEYLVDDGTVIKLKPVVTEIVRVDDMYDAEGNPVYLISSTNVVSVSAPEQLRKKE